MDTSTILCAAGLLIGLAYVWSRKTKADGRAFFWATISEPLDYRTEDIDDTTVIERANEARRNLKEHGNPYLNDDDIWEYIYGATPGTETRDFSQWRDFVALDVVKRREAWREQKRKWNPDAAKHHFAGEKIQDGNTASHN
jgi:hypothetical protein